MRRRYQLERSRRSAGAASAAAAVPAAPVVERRLGACRRGPVAAHAADRHPAGHGDAYDGGRVGRRRPTWCNTCPPGISLNDTDRRCPRQAAPSADERARPRAEIDRRVERQQRARDVAAVTTLPPIVAMLRSAGPPTASRRRRHRAPTGPPRVVVAPDHGRARSACSTPSSPARARPTTASRERPVQDGGHHGRAPRHQHRAFALAPPPRRRNPAADTRLPRHPLSRPARTCAPETPPPRGSGRSRRRTARGADQQLRQPRQLLVRIAPRRGSPCAGRSPRM